MKNPSGLKWVSRLYLKVQRKNSAPKYECWQLLNRELGFQPHGAEVNTVSTRYYLTPMPEAERLDDLKITLKTYMPRSSKNLEHRVRDGGLRCLNLFSTYDKMNSLT